MMKRWRLILILAALTMQLHSWQQVAAALQQEEGGGDSGGDIDPAGSRHTATIYLDQRFFDQATSDFVEPLLSQLTLHGAKNMTNQTVQIGENFLVQSNVTNITFDNASLNNTQRDLPIIQLGCDWARFQVANLAIDLTADYEFVSDPPIMADIGDLRLQTHNVSLNVTWQTEWDNSRERLVFNVTDVGMDLDQLYTDMLQLNGIADFVEVFSMMFDFVTTIIKDRLESFSNAELLNGYLSEFLTRAFALIPTQTGDIGNSGLYFDGLLMDNIEYLQDRLIMFKLSTLLLSEELSYVTQCQSFMPSYIATPYQIELILSECFINQAMISLNAERMFQFWFESPVLRTDVIADMIGDSIFDDFNHLQPCKMYFEVPEDMSPVFYMFDTQRMEIVATFNSQIFCRKNRKDKEFYPVATIQYEMTVTLWFVLLSSARITGHIFSDGTELMATKVIEQWIPEVDLINLNTGLGTVTEALISVTNKYLQKDLSLEPVLRLIPVICALDLNKMVSMLGYKYLAFMFTPIYTVDESKCESTAWAGGGKDDSDEDEFTTPLEDYLTNLLHDYKAEVVSEIWAVKSSKEANPLSSRQRSSDKGQEPAYMSSSYSSSSFTDFFHSL